MKSVSLLLAIALCLPVVIEMSNEAIAASDEGGIEGKVTYPSDFIPALTVCAQSVNNFNQLKCVQTKDDQRTYKLTVKPGKYKDATHIRIGRYHPEATSEYRSTENSVRPYTSLTKLGLPTLMTGQQCTYDRNSQLITSGAGAGTPDAYSPEVTAIGQGLFSNNSHTYWDVKPFEANSMTWQEYQQTWIPNNGNNCPTNVVNVVP